MIPKSSNFLFFVIAFFLLLSLVSYFLFLKNLQDNHTKNQEIAFYQIQKSTNHLLTKLLYKYSEQKDEIVKKHKEVLDYLEQNSYDTSLDEIYKKINQDLPNKPYNIYITDENLVIKNTTVRTDMDFDLSFAKYLFDNHKNSNIIGISPPVFEMFSQKMMSYSDTYLPNSNRVLQISYTYENLDKDLENLKNLINENKNIINSNAYIIFSDGYVGDFIFKNIKSYKPSLKEIEQRIEKGKELFDSFDKNVKYFIQNRDDKTFFLLEYSPIFDDAKIIYSISFDETKLQKNIFLLKIIIFFIVIIGLITIYIIYKIRLKEFILNYKDKFIEHSIHEIKTPLAILNLNLQLKNEEFGEDKYSKKMEGAIKTLKNSYEDMTFLHTKSKIKYKIEKFNLEEFLKDRVKYFELIAKTQNRELKLEVANNVFVNISKIELERLVDNNISNAIKYSSVASTIKIILEDCVLKFISNGEKIKDTNIIFKRYVRENISLGGHGIGLSIVKDICDKYKIKIDVTSQENHNIFSYRLNCHTNITSKG